jgi:hypothetical protein
MGIDKVEQTNNELKADMATLFPIKESLSPKLAWIKKHKIKTMYSEGEGYCAYVGDIATACDECSIGWGDDMDDALVELARKKGLLMWNEEKYK